MISGNAWLPHALPTDLIIIHYTYYPPFFRIHLSGTICWSNTSYFLIILSSVYNVCKHNWIFSFCFVRQQASRAGDLMPQTHRPCDDVIKVNHFNYGTITIHNGKYAMRIHTVFCTRTKGILNVIPQITEAREMCCPVKIKQLTASLETNSYLSLSLA